MSLTVLGDNLQAWLVAAHASVSSGEPVALVAPAFERERLTLDVAYPDAHRVATLELAPELAPEHHADRPVIVAAPDMYLQQAALAEALRTLDGCVVVLGPGGVGGAVRAAAMLREAAVAVPVIGELTGFPVLGAMSGRTATITAVKRRLPTSALDAAGTTSLVDSIGRYLPDVVPAQSILATSLANTNHVVHPPLALVNAARIDSGLPFRFYREGLTSAGARLIEAVDRERLSVTDALRLERVPIAAWFRRFYGDQGMAGDDIATMLGTFPPFTDSLGPSTLRHRYLVDDVGSGLAVIEALGRIIGVPMPITAAVCEVASALVGYELGAGATEAADALLMNASSLSSPSDARAGAFASAGNRERS